MAELADLKEVLSRVFDNFHDGLKKEVSADEYARLKFDFVFHMTDWKEDFARLHELYAHPEKWSAEDASRTVAGFLIHVKWHLEQAHKLLLGDDLEASEVADAQLQRTGE
jgi:hypothetical protein